MARDFLEFIKGPDHVQDMQDEINRPIFIVGSGRSGSTILTWCLGQHPNIIPQEESDWLGPFAIDAVIADQRGSAPGERGQRTQISFSAKNCSPRSDKASRSTAWHM